MRTPGEAEYILQGRYQRLLNFFDLPSISVIQLLMPHLVMSGGMRGVGVEVDDLVFIPSLTHLREIAGTSDYSGILNRVLCALYENLSISDRYFGNSLEHEQPLQPVWQRRMTMNAPPVSLARAIQVQPGTQPPAQAVAATTIDGLLVSVQREDLPQNTSLLCPGACYEPYKGCQKIPCVHISGPQGARTYTRGDTFIGEQKWPSLFLCF